MRLRERATVSLCVAAQDVVQSEREQPSLVASLSCVWGAARGYCKRGHEASPSEKPTSRSCAPGRSVGEVVDA